MGFNGIYNVHVIFTLVFKHGQPEQTESMF